MYDMSLLKLRKICIDFISFRALFSVLMTSDL